MILWIDISNIFWGTSQFIAFSTNYSPILAHKKVPLLKPKGPNKIPPTLKPAKTPGTLNPGTPNTNTLTPQAPNSRT